jgi:ATP-dependent Clp protease protease subunit
LADAYNANDLQKLAEELQAESDKILDFYVERTGAERETLLAKMDADTAFGMEEAKELGFIHEIITPASAMARGWGITNKINSMDRKDKVRKVLSDLGELLGIKAEAPIVEAYELTTESGEVLTIDKPEGDPEVGDSASPDGEHKMPDGTTIVVVDGVITEIRPAEEEQPEEETPAEPNPIEEELAQAKDRIAELEAALAEAQAQAMSEEDKEVVSLVKTAGGIAWLKSASSNYNPDKRDVKVDGDVKNRVSRTKERLAELRLKQS